MDNIIEDVKEIKENDDIFGTYKKSVAICNFLESDENKRILENNNLVAIYGPWGSGKSCLMKTIYNSVDKEKFNVKWFDTWKYEKDENLAYSLFKFVGQDTFWDKIKAKGNSAISNIYAIFKSVAKGIDINYGCMNIKLGDMFDEAEKQGERLAEEHDANICLWERINKFEDLFKNIEINDNKRMIVFLDDLDRCESYNIISLISSIKILLSINKNIIFVIGIDKQAVTLALANKYNNDYNKADEYLEKIFPISFELINEFNSKNFNEYVSSIIGLDEDGANFIMDFFEYIHFTNPRHIKKVLRKYYFMKNHLTKQGIDMQNKQSVVLILYSIILSIFYGEEYKYFIRQDKEKIYNTMLLYYFDKDGTKKSGRYMLYERTCNIAYESGKSYNIDQFLARFSSYRIINKEIRGIIYLSGEARYNVEDWLGAFENGNICNEFIKYILSNDANIIQLYEDDRYDDKKVLGILKAINEVI